VSIILNLVFGTQGLYWTSKNF